MQIFQKKIFDRGAKGIIGLKKQFKLMDTDGSDSIDFDEFMGAISNFELDFSEKKARSIFESLDKDGGGTISIDEFLDGVIGPLSDLRARLVQEAFIKLDVDNSGTLEISEVESKFDAKRHPEVLVGEKSAEQAKIEFLNLFRAHNKAANGGSVG